MAKETFINIDESTLENENSLSSVQMLRSELAQEIISRKAGFLEKWSLLIFLAILLLILGSTWFVQYPDTIASQAVLTAENSPKEIRITQEGRLVKLFVKNNQPVKKNEVIGWIESEGDHNQINELGKQIDRSIYVLNTNAPGEITSILNTNLNNLGELQQGYDQFLLVADAFSKYILNNANIRPKQSEHFIDRQKVLFQQQILQFKNQVAEWQKKYVLQAPIDGIFIVNSLIEENKYLQAGTALGYINPNNGNYYAETILPQNNLGKLTTGLQVQLRVDAYPYEEWGFLNGTISYISSVPIENGFLAIIKLNNGLITNSQKRLIYKNGLRAQAIIITKDMRLLQKFYYGFVKSTSIDK